MCLEHSTTETNKLPNAPEAQVKFISLAEQFPDPNTLPKAYGDIYFLQDLLRVNGRAVRASQTLFLVYTCPYCNTNHVHGLEREQVRQAQAPIMLAPCGLGKYTLYASGRWAARNDTPEAARV